MDENFEDIFQSMYEERFVDRIFGEQQRMTKDEFIEKIEGTAAEKALEALNKLKGRYNFFGGGKKKKKNFGPDDTNTDLLE